MTGDELIAEGRHLARPCLHLRPDGDAAALAAIWRGAGLFPPAGGGHEHWLTIDCHFLPWPADRPTGTLSIYTNRDCGGVVTHDSSATLSAERGGRPLYAHPTDSLPPLEAVFLRGSSAVAAWLASLDWPADEGPNGNFPDAQAIDAYSKALRANLPFDGELVFAVLGGWPVSWPDGGWPELADLPLVALTLAESEPWVEAFRVGDGYRVIQRVS